MQQSASNDQYILMHLSADGTEWYASAIVEEGYYQQFKHKPYMVFVPIAMTMLFHPEPFPYEGNFADLDDYFGRFNKSFTACKVHPPDCIQESLRARFARKVR